MTMSRNPLRRWIHRNKPAAGTEVDEQGVRAALRERQQLRQVLDADDQKRKEGPSYLGGWGP
jgi:uncharacterized membrane protein